jgi:hypothetical protein
LFRSGLARTALAWVIAAALVGGLTVEASLLVGYAQPSSSVAIECAVFPVTQHPQSTSTIRLTAPGTQAARLDLDFLDLDGDVIQTRSLDLAPGATTTLTLPTRYVGTAVQVVATHPVLVEATLTDPNPGPNPERLAIPCQPIAHPIRAGGPRTPDASSANPGSTRASIAI